MKAELTALGNLLGVRDKKKKRRQPRESQGFWLGILCAEDSRGVTPQSNRVTGVSIGLQGGRDARRTGKRAGRLRTVAYVGGMTSPT